MELFETPTITPFSAAVATIAVVLVVLLLKLKDRGLLPGPTGIPFLGYYPFLRQDYHVQLQEMMKKYGDVFSINITGQTFIHIGSIKALREAHISKADCFQQRITRYNILRHCFENGLSFLDGDQWKVLRKFYVQTMKDYGLTSIKDNMAGPIYDSLLATIEDIKKTEGSPFDTTSLFTKHCTKTMRQLLFSGVEISDEDQEALLSAYVDVMGGMMGMEMILTGPISEYIILPLMSGHREMITGKIRMEKLLLKIVKDHESSLDENHPRDLVDCYYRERNVRARKNDPTASYFTDVELVATLMQLTGDGVIAVAHFISLFLFTMTEHPEVQEKIWEEMNEVIGPDRQPSWEDKSRLPYCNAAILEVSRSDTPLTIFPSLECTHETTLNGYRIPKGSVTLVNNYAIFHDPELYKDPFTFEPMRFIAKPDKPKEETPMPFGVGKRACAGESFVMMQVFLFMLTIVKNFKLTKPEGVPNPSGWSELKMEICAHPRTKH